MIEKQTLGWAELECALAYNECSALDLNRMVQIFMSHGFQFYEKRKFGGFTLEGEGLNLSEDASYEDFIEEITKTKCNVAAVNLYGTLYDLRIKIGLCIFPMDNVIIISTRENFIWGHGDNLKLSNINRLIAFYALCKEVCTLLPPKYAFISSEEAHPDEINVDNAEENGFTPYDEKMFSDENARELLDWYLKTFDK